MSKYRENVTWQDPNGLWCMGFFTVVEPFDAGPDFDDEWDVDYDYTTFEFATTGHSSEDVAWQAAVYQDRPNPGHTIVYRLADKPRECAEFDRMAAAWATTGA